jgi:hypothetical protein
MRLPGLSSTVLLVALFCVFQVSTLVAQRGGGGSSAGSSPGPSAGSSGGSHGGGGASSAGSSGGHGSAGSASRGSSSHGSGPRSSAAQSNLSRSYTFGSLNEKDNAHAPKRGFLSFLRHPFSRHPKEKPERLTQFRHRVCLNGACRVCPIAQVPGAGGCVTPHIYLRRSICSHRDVWAGGSCLLQVSFVDDCAGPRMAMAQQARRVREAAAARESQCGDIFSQQCVDLTSNAQRESSFYQVLQDKYKQCQVRSRGSASFGSNPFSQRGAGRIIYDADH